MRTSLETASPSADNDAPGSAHVYTVPLGRPFLHALATAILKGDLPIAGGRAPLPLDLPGITLLLPTRRAARAMQDAFLAAGSGRALLLPQIRPISEGEEELTLLTGLAASDTLGMDTLDLPPAVSEIERIRGASSNHLKEVVEHATDEHLVYRGRRTVGRQFAVPTPKDVRF